MKFNQLRFWAPCLFVASMNVPSLWAEKDPEKKVVKQVLEESTVLEIEDFYIGDMGVAAYETHEAKDFKTCSKVLTKIAGFAMSEAQLSRRPEAAVMLRNSAETLHKLAARLLTKKPPLIDEIEPALAQIDQGLELSYGKSNNKALNKRIDSGPVEVVTAHLYSYTLSEVFSLARTDWAEGRSEAAASKLAKAETFMSNELAAAHTDEGRVALTSARDDLRDLVIRLSRSKVKVEAELDAVFANCHDSLALAYQKRSILAQFLGRQSRLEKEAAEQKKAAEALLKK